MGLEQVVDEILAGARQEAEEIEQEAEQRAQALRDDARSEAQRGTEETLGEAESRAQDRARRIRASAQLEKKKQRLAAESDVLATVRARVEDQLRNLPSEERTAYMKALVEEADAHEIGQGAKAWGREDDREAIEALGFEFEGSKDILGGVIVENAEGTVREDLRFETVLDRIWRASAHDIASQFLER